MFFRCVFLSAALASALPAEDAVIATSLRQVGEAEGTRRLKNDDVKIHDNGKRTLKRDLLPSTGFNDICGDKIMDDFGIQMQFTFMEDTSGGAPKALTPALCEAMPDARLVTFANRAFYAMKGWPLPDPRLENLPYNEVPITVGLDGMRSFVSDHILQTGPIGGSHSYPNHAETVQTFLQVSGKMHLTCNPDGSAEIEINGEGYLEGEILTVWVLWSNLPPMPPLLPMALGGTPNVVVVDEDGTFVFKRSLNFCPLDVQNDGKSSVVSFALAKHLDGGCTYGNVPQNVLTEYTFKKGETEMFTSNGNGPGIMTVDKGMIVINTAPLSTQ